MQARRTLALALAALALSGCAHAADPLPAARDRALAHLAALPPGPLAPYVLEAAVAAGEDPRAWPPGHPAFAAVQLPGNGTPLLSFLRPAFALSRVPGVPDRDATYNRIAHAYDGRQFGDPALLDDDTFALWTLSAIVPDWSLEPWHSWADGLLANQTAAGGWSWAVNGTADTDSTGIALSALASTVGSRAEGNLSAHLPAVRSFLATVRNADGGFAAQPKGTSNCDSTVWGIRATALAGGNVSLAPSWSFLLGLQRGDGGFAYRPGDRGSNDLCSAEATILLADGVAGRVAH